MKSYKLVYFCVILIKIFISCTYNCNAQQRISYTYDQSGNRKQRSYSLLRVKENLKDYSKDSSVFKVQVSPNPASDQITVSISTTDDFNAAIKLSDEEGNVLQSLFESRKQFQMDLSAYKAGVYFITIGVGNVIKSIRILKLD